MSMGPLVRIAYHVPGMERRRQVVVAGDGNCAGGNDARELGVVVRGNEEVRRVSVRPVVPVVIDEVVATLRVSLDAADALYLNGYNAWTDSVERPPAGRMWGLTRAPRSMVEASVLDGSGDYRFVEEDAHKGHQHGFGYGYLRQGDEVLLFGSLDEDSGFTLIREDLEEGTLTLDKEPPARIIGAGETCEVLALCVTGGPLDQAVEHWLGLAGIRALPSRPLVGYTSWQRHFEEIDACELTHDLEGVVRVLGAQDLEGMDPVFQIDAGSCKVGDWLDVDEERFPQGLVTLARDAAACGLVPGLWLAPFVCERESRLYAEHPAWILRDEHGDVVKASGAWSGAYALDVRNDEVRTYLGRVLRTVTEDWGFRLLKLDHLYAACMVVHDGLNRGELMADALEFLRAQVAPGTRLLLSGVPLVSAFGRCEYCRSGPEVGLDWDDLPVMRLLQRERVSTKWAVANARFRAHLNGRAFRCDPGVLLLREEGVSLSASQRVQLFVVATTCGGVMLTADDMGAWGEVQLAKYREALDRFSRANGLRN